jgi:uridine kinase
MEQKMIEIHCKNNDVTKEYPAGTSLGEIYDDLKPKMPYGVIAARANNKTKNLRFCVYKPKEVEFIGLESDSGRRAYIRSLSFVMYKAVNDLFPGIRLRIVHPISNGYYCRLLSANGETFPIEGDPGKVEALRSRMAAIIAQDLTFELVTLPTARAINIFQKENAQDKINLLKSLGNLYASIYRLDDLYDYYDGALAPSTGSLKLFNLMCFHDGLLLQMPARLQPDVLEPYVPQDKLFDAFAEYTHWNEIMGLANVGDMNLRVGSPDDAGMLITVAETLQEKKIDRIADAIVADPRKKVVLIAGPSSSGKTTFSKKLSIHLAVDGKMPIPFSLDDYFVNREDTPKDESGDYDFESIYALDLDFFNKQLNQMLNGEEVELPYYNFTTGKREFRGNKIKLGKDSILVIEGIHGLNPELTAQIPEANKFRIYASALTSISLDDHNWIPTTDNRLLRRIVRDYKYRGYSAEQTINRWASVRKGEEKWIFPFQEQADIMFNSALIFELPVLKTFAEPIINQVPQWSPAYAEAHRLLKFLQYLKPIPDANIPTTSLLREFFGGSSFHY